MTSKPAKQLPHEKRKGEAALSDFAEYVEKQQALRYPSATASAAAGSASGSGAAKSTAPGATTAQHRTARPTAGVATTASATTATTTDAELDALLDQLGFGDDDGDGSGGKAKHMSMRTMLLGAEAGGVDGGGGGDGKAAGDGEDDEPLARLSLELAARLDESHGEFVFDVGFEHSAHDRLNRNMRGGVLPTGAAGIAPGLAGGGESLGLTLEEWNIALSRLERAARAVNADTQLLLTKGVPGSEVGVEADMKPAADSAAAAAAATAAGSADAGAEAAAKSNGAAVGSTTAGAPGKTGSTQARKGGAAAAAKNKRVECTGKVMVRRVPAKVEDVIETRIAVVGNVDAGKSSMLGVLVKGELDDGRGKARVNLFRHKHEIETGRTSSVGMEIMGFDTKGRVVTSDVPGRKLSWEEIGKRSAKVITFTDLAGHERYLRTTVFGLLSSSPNYCLLMVAANNGLIGMSKEHLGIALALNVPVMVVVTKIDICPPHILEQTMTQITRILKSPGARKIPIQIRTREDAVVTATQFVSQRICPVFQVSNVTGENLDLVRTFLNILPHHGRYDAQAPFEFHVNDTFSVPFVGTVVSGIVKSGVIHAGDQVLIGPDSLGQFIPTAIKSIERKRIGVPAASAGQSASFALKKVRRKDVRKGMVVLPKTDGGAQPKVYREFIAEVLILSHATTIKPRYQAMLHVGPVSQTCAIIDIDRAFIRTGDRATVAFRFVQRPEYLAPGDRLLFREGRTKGLGIVKAVGYDPTKPLSSTASGNSRANEESAEKNGAAEMKVQTVAEQPAAGTDSGKGHAVGVGK